MALYKVFRSFKTLIQGSWVEVLTTTDKDGAVEFAKVLARKDTYLVGRHPEYLVTEVVDSFGGGGK